MPTLTRPTAPLVGRTVTLRQFVPNDAPAVAAACQDTDISRWTTIQLPYSEQDALGWIGQHERFWASGRGAPFAMVSTPTGEFLGSISATWFDWINLNAVFGYWVAVEARKCGVATTGLAMIIDWSFTTLDIREAVLHTQVGNRASERVAEKAGFTKHRVDLR